MKEVAIVLVLIIVTIFCFCVCNIKGNSSDRERDDEGFIKYMEDKKNNKKEFTKSK